MPTALDAILNFVEPIEAAAEPQLQHQRRISRHTLARQHASVCLPVHKSTIRRHASFITGLSHQRQPLSGKALAPSERIGKPTYGVVQFNLQYALPLG